MADYEARFEGLDALIKKIEKIEKMGEAKSIVRKHVSNTAKRSQELVPVGWGRKYPAKTPKPKGYVGGTLKRSMKQNISDGGLSGEIVYYTDYAAYQEFGTRFIPARKYLGTPFMSEKVRFINELRELVK